MTGARDGNGRREYRFRGRESPGGPAFRYEPVSERLFRGADAVPLQPRAAAVLGHLLAEHGRLVSRDELIDEVWGGMPVADGSVTEAIGLVRGALDDDRRDPSFIQTVPKRGYRFIAPVERVLRQPAQDLRATSATGIGAWVLVMVVGVLVGLLGWWVRGGPTDPGPSASVAVRVPLALPAPARPGRGEGPALTLSPDGRRLAYVAAAGGEGIRLHVVDLARGTAWPLEGSRGRPRAPFFSADGEAIAYFQRGRLLVVSLMAGRTAIPEPMASVPRAHAAGGSWHRDGRIVLSPGVGHGLSVLEPGIGGEPRRLTTLEPGERAHLTPDFLPDGRVLFSVLEEGAYGGPPRLEVVDAAGGRRPVVGVPGGIAPRFVPPASLVFARSSSLFSAPLDVDDLTAGEPRPIEVSVRGDGGAAAHFAASREGTLALLPAAESAGAALHWVDLGGGVEVIGGSRGGPLDRYRISPDGRQVVGQRQGDLWTYELSGATFRRLTASPRPETAPVWGPEPGQVTYAASRGGRGLDLRTMRVEEPGRSELLLAAEGEQVPEDWSPDGRRLLFTRLHPATGEDLWIMDRSGEVRPLVATDAAERAARFSPDGRWVAFVSDRSGSDEIWSRPVEGTDETIPLTRGGGTMPRWGPEGDALYFRRGPDLVRLAGGPEPSAGARIGSPVFTEADPTFRYELEPQGARALVQRHGTSTWWREALLVQAWQRRDLPAGER